MRRQSLPALALLFITFAAYFPALNNGFIWDDDRYIEQNSNLRTLHGLQRIWLNPLHAEPQYYPLTHTTLWIEFHLWHLHPLGYHLDNLLLHAASAVLLWRILLRLGIPGAWAAAAIFAIHPLQVESVAWATERKNVLSGFFYFLSILAYLRTRWGRQLWDSNEDARVGAGWYIASILLFFAAILSKSVASTMPAAIPLLLWWKRGKLHARDFFPLIPMIVIGIAMGSLTGWMEKHIVGAMGPDFDFLTPLDRICIAGRAFWFYFVKLFAPYPLMFIYPHWNVDPIHHPASILFPISAAGLLIALWILRRKLGRGPIAATLFFAGTLLPALGFVNVFPMRFSYVADHFQYLACIGPIVLLIAIFARLQKNLRIGILIAVLACFCVLSNLRTRVFLDRRTLWADTLAKNPTSPMVQNNYAYALMHAGELDAAQSHFREAMRLQGDAADWVGMGQCYAIAGDYLKARDMYLTAIEKSSRSTEPVFQHALAGKEFQLGTAYQALAGAFPAQAGEYFSQAEQAYRRAISLFPEFEDPRTNLASMMVAQRRFNEAIEQCQAVLTENPDSVSARMNMGNAYYSEGRLDLALEQYWDAMNLDPENASALASAGGILARQGQLDRAIELLRRALAIDPNNPIAQQNYLAAMTKAAQSKP